MLSRASTEEVLPSIYLHDFTTIIQIGKGGYGKVDLVRKNSTGELFALKTVNIKFLKEKCLEKSLMHETMILNEINHECLVRCFYVFSDEENYYYVMEFIGGGDLQTLINKYNLNPNIIKIFISEMILAFDHLHSKEIFHRDVKPENILISNDVYIKLNLI